MKLQRLATIEFVLLVILTGALALLDISLQLGDFHGLVFSIYMAYASAAFFIINVIIAIVNAVKGKEGARYYLVIGILTGLAGLALAYIGGRIL